MPANDHDTALNEALDWLLRLEDADAACQARFEHWLDASPTHAEAFARAQRCWQSPLLGSAAAQLQQRQRPRPPRRLARSLAVAASLLLMLGLASHSDLLLRLRADHVTAVGQRQQLDLTDGSQVLLNTGSAFSSQIDGQHRVSQLLRGEAYFDIAHDRSRPFEVSAGPLQITVRGTAFAVRYLNGEAQVSVERGEVEVRARNSDTRILLGHGDSLRVSADGVSRRTDSATSAQLAWVHNRLVFTDQPLHEVLAELQRYYPGWIVNRNARLDDLHVTGNYRLSEPASIMRSLAQVSAARLDEYPGLLILN